MECQPFTCALGEKHKKSTDCKGVWSTLPPKWQNQANWESWGWWAGCYLGLQAGKARIPELTVSPTTNLPLISYDSCWRKITRRISDSGRHQRGKKGWSSALHWLFVSEAPPTLPSPLCLGFKWCISVSSSTKKSFSSSLCRAGGNPQLQTRSTWSVICGKSHWEPKKQERRATEPATSSSPCGTRTELGAVEKLWKWGA